MENAVSWDVAPCSSRVNRRFRGTYHLRLQGRKIRERGTSVSMWLQIWSIAELLVIFLFCHRMSDIKFTFHNLNLLDYDWLYFITQQGCPTSHHWTAAIVLLAYLPAGRIIRIFLFQYSDRYLPYREQKYNTQKLGLLISTTLIHISIYLNINNQNYKVVHWIPTRTIKYVFWIFSNMSTMNGHDPLDMSW
jgi:hypothetical protein